MMQFGPLVVILPTEASARGFATVVVDSMLSEINELRGEFMAFKQDVDQVIADEKAQVAEGFAALNAKIAELEAKLAAGEVVTAEDMASIKASVADIFTPEPAPGSAQPAPEE